MAYVYEAPVPQTDNQPDNQPVYCEIDDDRVPRPEYGKFTRSGGIKGKPKPKLEPKPEPKLEPELEPKLEPKPNIYDVRVPPQHVVGLPSSQKMEFVRIWEEWCEIQMSS